MILIRQFKFFDLNILNVKKIEIGNEQSHVLQQKQIIDYFSNDRAFFHNYYPNSSSFFMQDFSCNEL